MGPVIVQVDADAAALEGCHTIEGDLLIGPCQSCEDNALSCETCADPAALSSLDGLSALTRVTGTVAIGYDREAARDSERWRGPTALTNVDALSGLQHIGGDLRLDGAQQIEVPEFSNLVSVDGSLRVTHSFPAQVRFPALERVSDVLLAGESWSAFDFPVLDESAGVALFGTNVPSLPGLDDVGLSSRLAFDGNDQLATIPFDALPPIDSFTLRNSPLIEAIDLTHLVPRTANIEWNERVETLRGDGIETMQSLRIMTVPLTSASFPDLTVVESDLFIIDTALSSLEGWANLQRVGNRVSITHNPNLCQSEAEAFVEGIDATGWVSVKENADC